jgi:hypothetical protein
MFAKKEIRNQLWGLIQNQQMPNPHDVAIAAVSGNTHEGIFPLPTYIPLDTNARTQAESPFSHLTGATGNAAPSDISMYGIHVPDSSSAGYQADHDWHQAGHHMGFSNPVTTAGPVDASLSSFGYIPYGEQHQGVHIEGFPSSLDHGYVSPSNLDLAASYVYDWNMYGEHGGQALEHDMASSHSETGQMSPIETRPGTRTPSSFTSTSSGGLYSAMYAGTASINPQIAASMGGGSTIAPGRGPRENTASKKGKGRQKSSHSRRPSGKTASAPAPPASAFASSSGESSLSGTGPSSSRGSRLSTSSRIAQPPAERLDEKKTRGTHNLVEKQYRNRLNARFEDLMNALPPESLRSPVSSLGGFSEATATADAAERRASKGEVLELARQHIQQLEQRRDSLARERDELVGVEQRLQEMYASQSPAHGRANEGGAGHDEEEEEDAKEAEEE